MNSKRIGTVTAGLFMVVLGALLFANLIAGVKIPFGLIKIWPVLIISLGLEILYRHYRTKEDSSGQDVKLRYDLMSMFMLFIIGITAIGLYAFQSSGLNATIEDLQNSSIYTVKLAQARVPVKSDVDRIVIKNRDTTLNVIVKSDASGSADNENLEIDGVVTLAATSKNKAQQLADEDNGYSIKRQGNSLLIETHQVHPGKWFMSDKTQAGPLTIKVPSHLALDLDSSEGDISMAADKIDAGWFVKQRSGSLDITLPLSANADITAYASQVVGKLRLTNGEQGTTRTTTKTRETSETAASDNSSINSAPETADEHQAKEFYSRFGKGGPLLQLINPSGTIAVYQKR